MSDRRPMSNPPGQYDYPPASEAHETNTSSYDFDAIPQRLQALRNRLTDEQARAAFNPQVPRTSALPPPSMPRSPADSESQNRMRSVLRAIHENEGSPPSELAMPSGSPGVGSMAPPIRRRARPSERFQRLNDQRARRLQRTEDATEDDFNLQEASRRLARSNVNLRSLLDESLNEIESRSPRPAEVDDMIHTSESQHRRKRRRTEGPSRSKSPPLYPVQGQVHSKSLDMEVRHNMEMDSLITGYDTADGWNALCLDRVKNILRDDTVTYSPKHRRTNIVMQHSGERLFTTNRVVIKTPDRIDDDYVLQGLVFTSREIDAIFERTAQYQIHHLPASRFSTQIRNSAGGLRNYLSNIRSSNQGQDTSTALPPMQDLDDNPQRPQVSADCDAESVASDSDESVDSCRPENVVGTQATSAFHSESDSDSGLSPNESGFTGPPPPVDRFEWTRSRLREAPLRQADPENTNTDDPFGYHVGDDPDDVAAQFDFDEVLRRGAAASVDRRRRRAATRERVQRQRAQERAEATTTATENPTSPPPPNLEQNANRPDASEPLHPQVLEPIEPPAQPEEPRWLDPPARTQYTDPPPTYPGRTQAWAVDPNELSLDYKLMEPAAFFSASRQARLRYSNSPRFYTSHVPPAATHPETSTPQSASTQDVGDSVNVSYKSRPYGGRVTIDFEAPISARYILLKLWKSRRTKNGRQREVDVHDNVRLMRVRVEGWCGMRYFPAVEVA